MGVCVCVSVCDCLSMHFVNCQTVIMLLYFGALFFAFAKYKLSFVFIPSFPRPLSLSLLLAPHLFLSLYMCLSARLCVDNNSCVFI